MNTHHELDTNKPGHKQIKHRCPACNQKRYVRFINADTLAYLPYEYGRCDREEKCAYFRVPGKEHYQSDNAWRKPVEQKPVVPPSYMDHGTVSATLGCYEKNTFVQCLVNAFGATWAYQAAKDFLIGTADHWPGATVFWYIDKECRARSGKVMLFGTDCRRRKDKDDKGKDYSTWVHSVMRLKNFNLSRCFFNEHALIEADAKASIGIVESEKTAIVCSYFLPKYIWLAAGGKGYLNAAMCQVLKGRKIVLFPDLSDSARSRWKSIADQVSTQYSIDCTVSKYLGHIDTGEDIADYLLQGIQPHKAQTFTNCYGNVCTNTINQYGYPESWDEIS